MNKNIQRLTKQFNKFVGKTLKDPKRLTSDVDTTLEQMKKVAADNGLKLRVWFPGTVGTMDMRTDRMNVRMDQKTLRIEQFYIG